MLMCAARLLLALHEGSRATSSKCSHASFHVADWLGAQVRGLQTHGDQKARWEQLAGLVADVLDRLLERAARLPRNYILDQTKCALPV